MSSDSIIYILKCLQTFSSSPILWLKNWLVNRKIDGYIYTSISVWCFSIQKHVWQQYHYKNLEKSYICTPFTFYFTWCMVVYFLGLKIKLFSLTFRTKMYHAVFRFSFSPSEEKEENPHYVSVNTEIKEVIHVTWPVGYWENELCALGSFVY